jgi:branched-chain amino acid transport system ATP-binding protein
MPVLEVDDLVSFYGKVEVVSHVSLIAEVSETVALLGRNGAGKTALLRTIMGHAQPVRRQGRVRLEGQDITGLPAYEIARRGIGMAPDNHLIFPHLTVEENLILAQKLTDRRRQPRSLGEIYALFPMLADLKDRSGAVLSGGERKLLAIARAIVQRPAILLLDETSEGLSPVLVQQLIVVLKRLRAEQITMLIADQKLRFCNRIAARAYVLERGRIQFAGMFDELWKQVETRGSTYDAVTAFGSDLEDR